MADSKKERQGLSVKLRRYNLAPFIKCLCKALRELLMKKKTVKALIDAIVQIKNRMQHYLAELPAMSEEENIVALVGRFGVTMEHLCAMNGDTYRPEIVPANQQAAELRRVREREEERQGLRIEMQQKLEEADGRLHSLITENTPTGKSGCYSDTLINDSSPGKGLKLFCSIALDFMKKASQMREFSIDKLRDVKKIARSWEHAEKEANTHLRRLRLLGSERSQEQMKEWAKEFFRHIEINGLIEKIDKEVARRAAAQPPRPFGRIEMFEYIRSKMDYYKGQGNWAKAMKVDGETKGGGFKCHKCGKTGHKARQCKSSVELRTCRICKKTGHLAKDCKEKPDKQGEDKGQKVRFIDEEGIAKAKMVIDVEDLMECSEESKPENWVHGFYAPRGVEIYIREDGLEMDLEMNAMEIQNFLESQGMTMREVRQEIRDIQRAENAIFTPDE